MFFLAVMMSAYAQSEIKAYGDNPKALGLIQGEVRDSIGPLPAFICEKNFKNEEVDFTFAGLDGHFSFKLKNPADSIEIRAIGYYTIKAPITKNHYDVLLQRDPNIPEEYVGSRTEMKRGNFRPDDIHPLLYLNNRWVTPDRANWDGLDYTKDTFSKKEIALLLGIEANSIIKIEVLKGKAATKRWSTRAKNGSIEVWTTQPTGQDILRKKEYTLQEWYDLNPSLYSILLKPTAGEFSTKSVKASYVETKSVRKSRDRQVRQLLDEGAIVNKFEPLRVSSFRDSDGYLLSKETDFGKMEDGDSIVIYLPISITFNGTLTIRLDSEFGPIIGHFDFTKTDRRNKLIESCVLDYGNISGRHDVYFFYPYEYNGHNLSGFPSRDRWYLKRF